MTQQEREQREMSARQVISEWQQIKVRLLAVVGEIEAHNERASNELRRREIETDD